MIRWRPSRSPYTRSRRFVGFELSRQTFFECISSQRSRAVTGNRRFSDYSCCKSKTSATQSKGHGAGWSLRQAIATPHVNIQNEMTNRKSPKDNSLEFLIGQAGTVWEKSYLDAEVGGNHLPKEYQPPENTGYMEPVIKPEISLNSSRQIVEFARWSKEVTSLCDLKAWSGLARFLESTSVSDLDSQNHSLVFELLNFFMENRQYMSALYLFDEFETRLLGRDEKSISSAICAASKAQQHGYCEYLYEKYSSGHKFPIETSEEVLKSFISNYNFTEAKAFLDQLSGVREHTMFIYIIGASKVAENAEELEIAFWRWKAITDGHVGENIYGITLEGLQDLESEDRFARIFDDCRRNFSDDSPVLNGIYIENALLTKRWSDADAIVHKALVQHLVIPKRAFLRVARKFALEGDMEGINKCTSVMISAGHSVSSSLLNEIGSGLSAYDKKFDIIRFLEMWESQGIMGNAHTVRWVLTYLQNRYASRSGALKKQLVLNLKKCPTLMSSINQWDSDGSGEEEDQILRSRNPSGTAAALSKIQRLVDAGRADRALIVIEDLIRRRIRPPKVLFYPIMRSLKREGLKGEIELLLLKMIQVGHKIGDDIQLKLFDLQDQLHSLRKPKTETYSAADRQMLFNTVHKFWLRHHSELSIEAVTMLGRELMKVHMSRAALKLIDSKRALADSPISLINHDSVSLTEMVSAYTQLSDYRAITVLIDRIISDQWGGLLEKYFFKTVKKAAKKAARHEKPEDAQALLSSLDQANQYNRDVLKDAEIQVKEISRLFQVWDKMLLDSKNSA